MKKLSFVLLLLSWITISCVWSRSPKNLPYTQTTTNIPEELTSTREVPDTVKSTYPTQVITLQMTTTPLSTLNKVEKILPTQTSSPVPKQTTTPSLTALPLNTQIPQQNINATAKMPYYPTITPLPISILDLSSEHELWVYLSDVGVYQSIDFANHSTRVVLGEPQGCYEPQKNFKVLCVDPEMHQNIAPVFLFDILSRQSTIVPIEGKLVDWSMSYNNGIVYYLSQNGETSTSSLFSHDPVIQTTTLLISGIDVSNRFVGPFPSSDGKRFIIYMGDKIYEITNWGNFILKSPENQSVSDFNFAWSPVAPFLAYGTYKFDIVDVSVDPCCINITDLNTGKTEQLNKEIMFYDYGKGWPSWSSDGEKIAAIHHNTDLCIFIIDIVQEKCYQVKITGYSDFQIANPIWSPDRKYISFIAYDNQNIQNDLLMIFDTIRQKYYTILSYNGNLMTPFWR